MRLSISSVCSVLVTMSILPVPAQDTPAISGLSSLPEVEFSQLSQRDPNPLGEKSARDSSRAMETRRDRPFHLSFRSQLRCCTGVGRSGVSLSCRGQGARARTAGRRYEVAHIYIFERPEEWQQFQAFGKLEPWTGGIHSQGSLFIQRNPAYKFSSNL